MRAGILASCLAVIASEPLSAAELRDCSGEEAGARYVAEPWQSNTRTFANGGVRIAVLDTEEPAAAAFHLLVLLNRGEQLCRVVSFTDAYGYGAMTLEGMGSSYDPESGLLLEIPMAVGPETHDRGSLFVTIRLNSGEILVEDIGS